MQLSFHLVQLVSSISWLSRSLYLTFIENILGYFVKSVDSYNINNAFVSGMYVSKMTGFVCMRLTGVRYKAKGSSAIPESVELYTDSMGFGICLGPDS
jgi:hypothetical protein